MSATTRGTPRSINSSSTPPTNDPPWGRPKACNARCPPGTDASSGIFAHRRSRSVVVVRNFHDDQRNSPRSSARLARWSARQATSMPNLTSLMAWSFLWVTDQSAPRCRPLHVPQGCDHPDIREAEVQLDHRPPSSRTGMHVRREARLVDDHRFGVELSLALTPNKSSQKNRPNAPYEGHLPNRWMPRTNAKCPLSWCMACRCRSM